MPTSALLLKMNLIKEPDAPIRVDEMMNITELSVIEVGVCCLTGLEEAKNLSVLRAGGNSGVGSLTFERINESKDVRFLGGILYQIFRLWEG